MISVLPVPEKERVRFCETHPVCREYSCIYSAVEGGREIGWFSVREEENRLVIAQMQLTGRSAAKAMGEEEKLIAELMIRSAASYALNRYLPELCCEEASLESYLPELKFEKNSVGVYTIPLQKLIHKCADCQKPKNEI